MNRLECEENIFNIHDNIVVNLVHIANGIPLYTLRHEDVISILFAMKCRKVAKGWTFYVGNTSGVLIESIYDANLYACLLEKLTEQFDTTKPICRKGIVDLRQELNPKLDMFTEENTKVICEIPLVKGKIDLTVNDDKFSPYKIPQFSDRIYDSMLMTDTFDELCVKLTQSVEEGINFLRVEASEIIAFLATDSERIVKPGIPPHIPIAYGLKGPSLSNKIFRNMRNDIRNELHSRKTSVLCEVYDGQFHDIIVNSDDGRPLTRLQHAKEHFKSVMDNNDKSDLLDCLLPYSEITSEDKNELKNVPFQNGKIHTMESITVAMKRVLVDKDHFIREIHITTNEVNNYSLKDIVTNHRSALWNKYLRNVNPNLHNANEYVDTKLSQDELTELIRGTKLHRRLFHQVEAQDMSELIDIDDSDDPDYLPQNEELSEISDSEPDVDISVHNLSTVSVSSNGQSCIKKILGSLQQLNNKHNWINETIDSLLKDYFNSKCGLSKFFMYEMDIINRHVKHFFGKELFQKKDCKELRVRKLFQQLKCIPQLMIYESSDDEHIVMHQPKTLFEIYRNFITHSKYPKEFLAAQVCKINHMESVSEWESRSNVDIIVDLPWINTQHLIFNYPEWNCDRKQCEMRTFDCTHILNNLRFHACNKGFDNLRTQAFIDVSNEDHDVLPRALVEDKIDRQNCTISQRFFSKDVQKILTRLGHDSEAQFVHYTRNWFRACDERGMDMKIRLWHLNNAYEYFLQHLSLTDYPPPTTHVGGIPIKTYEALLHSISTRFSLFQLSSNSCYNSRAISTLAVESFFSDLS